jgi:hypothetical protein
VVVGHGVDDVFVGAVDPAVAGVAEADALTVAVTVGAGDGQLSVGVGEAVAATAAGALLEDAGTAQPAAPRTPPAIRSESAARKMTALSPIVMNFPPPSSLFTETEK